jgi:hypothetical protein
MVIVTQHGWKKLRLERVRSEGHAKGNFRFKLGRSDRGQGSSKLGTPMAAAAKRADTGRAHPAGITG